MAEIEQMKRRLQTKMMMVMILTLVLVIGACRSPTSPDEPDTWYRNFTWRIKGTVTDAINGRPVRAYVYLFRGMGIICTASTDDLGQYKIEFTYITDKIASDASFSLYVEAEGYIAKSIDHTDTVHVRYTEEWQTIDVQLMPISGN